MLPPYASCMCEKGLRETGIGIKYWWMVGFIYMIQYIPRNMHTVLLCFALLWLCNRSYWIHMKYLLIFIRVTLLALGQSLDCHSASEVSLMDMGKISQCITTTKHSKATIAFFSCCRKPVRVACIHFTVFLWDIAQQIIFMIECPGKIKTI